MDLLSVSENMVVSDSWACSWDAFPPVWLSYPTLIWQFLLYLVIFCHVWLLSLFINPLFPSERQKQSGFRGEGRRGGTGRSKKGKTIIRIYCWREVFNERKTLKVAYGQCSHYLKLYLLNCLINILSVWFSFKLAVSLIIMHSQVS